MARVVATALAAALLAGPVAEAQQPPRVGDLKNLSARDLFPNGCDGPATFPHADFETHVAVNPRRPRHMIAAWIEGTGVTVVTAATHDGGRTWRQSKVPGLHCTGDAGTVLSGDPWVAFGRRGRAYLVLGTDVGGSDPSGSIRHVKVMASHSSNNGDSWSRAKVVEGSEDFNDKYAVTTDPRRHGHAWVVFTKGRPPTYASGDVYLSRTRNAGRTWSASTLILSTLDSPSPLNPWGATLRVLPNGDLLCAVMLWNPAGLSTIPLPSRPDFQAVAIRSRDDGRTWSAPVTIADVPVGRIQDPDGGANSRVRANQGVSLDTAADGTAFATWWQRGQESSGKVVLSKSRDGGRHWSEPKNVPGAARSAFLPAIATRGDRTVAVTYYDLGRDRPGDGRLTTDAWIALSRDAGAHWRTAHLAGPFDMRTAAVVDSARFVGDYFGLAPTPRGFAAIPALARPISRDGPSDVFYAPVSVNPRRLPRATVNLRSR